MTPLLSCENLHLSYGEHCLLDDASLLLYPGDRVALLGRNGAGKSTLFSLLCGQARPDAGSIRLSPGTRVAQLEQRIPERSGATVFDTVASGLEELGTALSRYQYLASMEGQQAIPHQQRIRELEAVQNLIESQDGWHFQQRVETILSKLKLPASEPLSALSGGWRRRVALGRALVKDPDILLLDEPTNHLDIESIEWLQQQLLDFRGALLFVTHDRSFLQALARRILYLDRGQLKSYDGSYEQFLATLEAELESEAKQHALFDKRLAEEERWIRQGIKARRTRNEGRVRALERMRTERAARRQQSGVTRMQLEQAELSGKVVLRVRKLHFSYAEHTLIRGLDLSVMRGDRIGILGPNGCGKSTLIGLLLGDIAPDSGSVSQGSKLSVAYFDQERDALDPDQSVIDNLAEGRQHIEINGSSRHVISYLNDFLFAPERCRVPVKSLSGGEVSRLLLAKLFSKAANLLVLDEPTNDLDIETLELLEELLLQFSGTVLLVSHDRAFMDNVVTSTLVFAANGQIEEHIGGYSDWQQYANARRKDVLTEGQARQKTQQSKSVAANSAETSPPAKHKLSYREQQELQTLPEKIESLEASIQELEGITAQADFYQQEHTLVNQTLAKLAEHTAQLEQCYERWCYLESIEHQGSTE